MSLENYKQKRELSKSGEPNAIIKTSSSSKRIYVIQEHQASHLHWDLRLELSGVLKSWALPKTPPRSKNIKHLAVQVEDHPLGYANFEGEIKEGYGKGTVKIWDKGTFELIHKDSEKIEFIVHGKVLRGTYVLVNAKLNGNEKNWLLIKTD